MTGNHRASLITPPDGSVPLKWALATVCEALGVGMRTWQVYWKKRGIPFVVVRDLRTRVDVDPESIPQAKEAVARWYRERAKDRLAANQARVRKEPAAESKSGRIFGYVRESLRPVTTREVAQHIGMRTVRASALLDQLRERGNLVQVSPGTRGRRAKPATWMPA